MNMKNNIILIGIAPNLTKQFIERSNALDCGVIVIEEKKDVDKNIDLIKEAETIISLDNIDYQSLKTSIKTINNNYEISGIITFRDYYTEPTATLIEELGFYGVPNAIVKRCNNKYESRKASNENAKLVVPTDYTLAKNKEDVVTFFKEKKYECVIKPVDEKGSFGAYKISSIDDIEKYYDKTKNFDKNSLGILVEKYIEGIELAFEVFVENGKSHIFGIAKKNMFKDTFIASGYSSIDMNELEIDINNYENIIQEIITNIGINFGPVLIEGFEQNGKFFFGEIHSRYGGEHLFDIAEYSSQFDLLTPIINVLIGKSNIINYSYDMKKYCESIAIYPGEGIVKEIVDKELKEDKNITTYSLGIKCGDKINHLESVMDRVGWIVYNCDKSEINKTRNKILSNLIIEMEEK